MSSHHSQLILPLYHHSCAIPSFLSHFDFKCMSISFLCHFFIPCSFQYFSIIRTSFHHLSVIPSIIFHVDNILSFLCHSIHSMVIWAVEWRGMTFCWNDRNEGRMIIWVIRSAFSSFLSSQMSWKNVVILDFIPAIPMSFRHLGVIQKFLINVNDPEWCWNDRNFWAEVDHFPYNSFDTDVVLSLYFMPWE